LVVPAALTINTYLQLVDQSYNSSGTGSEAVYTNSLTISSGTTLDLNGLHLYTRQLLIDGTVVNGTITQVPPSAPQVLGTPAPANSCYTVGGTVLIEVTFSQAVIVVGTPQLTLNDGAVVNYTSGSGTPTLSFTYVVAAGQNTADLDYASAAALTLNGGSIVDPAGNVALLTLPATGADGLAAQNIVIDTTTPTAGTVSTTAAVSSWYTVGGTVSIAVKFNEAVTVSGTPQLTLNDGAVVNYTGGSGTAKLTFTYVVAAEQNTLDLDYASTAALSLNGGSIVDPAGNVAVLTLPATGTDGLASTDIVIDTQAPVVAKISVSQGPATGGTTLTITGTGLTTASRVKFGTVAASSFTVDSDSQITVTSPAGAAGTVDVTVSTIGGTSITSSVDQFVYVVVTTTISWNAPAAIIYGTALSGAELDANAGVAGIYS
jgi:hypothetical protein